MKIREERAKMMGQHNIAKVLLKLGIPGIIAMLINAVYNVVDTIFVGMLNNTSAIGAVSVVFPIFILIAAVGQMFGIGAGSYISRLLGEDKKQDADKTASTTFFITIVISIMITILGLIFIVPILKLFGATDTIMPYAKDYARILILGSVFTITNMLMNNMIRAEGNAKYSMIAISLGAGINILLDPIFMFSLNMGVKGASLATVLAQIISTVFLVRYYLSGENYIKLAINYFTFSKKIYSEVTKIGIASFARQLLTSLALGLMNLAAQPYGDAAVASMGIALRVMSIGIFVVLGYNQGFQPIAGYNYGAKKYNRLNQAIKLSLKWTTIFSTVIALVVIFFAKEIIGGFSTDPAVIEIGSRVLRAMSLLFPLFGFQQVYAVLFQSIGKGGEALFLSLARQGIFLIPTILILPKFIGLNGVIFSQTIADFFTIIITAILAFRLRKELKSEETKDNFGKMNGVA